MDNQGEDGHKSADKKPQQQGSNMVLYMLGLGVLVLLIVSIWQSGSEVEIEWSELVDLIRASNPENSENPSSAGMIDVTRGEGDKKTKIRYSDLADVEINRYRVTGSVSRQDLETVPKSANGDDVTDDASTGGFSEKVKGLRFYTNRDPEERQLRTLLDENNIRHSQAPGPSPWSQYFPLLLIVTLFVVLIFIMMRRMGGAGSPMAFGRSRGKLYAQEDISITFAEVAGVDEAVDELREVVEFLRSPEKYQVLGGRIPKGVLLIGPPGTGKTLLAKAVAGEAGVPFFSLSGSDFVEMFVGVGAARVRDMFQQAEQKAPCIIFIDELDALGKTRGNSVVGGHDEREQTLNALLVEMDGFESNAGVIVLAATNRPETLDAALLRPGRFDRHVLVDRPDIAGREEILDVHLQNVRVDSDVNVNAIAAITSGFVGADLANLVNEAALLAARKGNQTVTMAEFNEGVERLSAGLEKKKRIMQDDEKQRVAYHESGHALVAYSLPNTDPVHKVSIIPRGLAALGYTMQRPEQDRFLMTQSELESRIQVLLAGTVAEEMFFEDVSTGAQNDLERATEIARGMVMDYGMSRLGRVTFRDSGRSPFLAGGGEGPQFPTHSEQTSREIDEEVKRILDESIEKVRHILDTRRAALEALSKCLFKQEVINSDELEEIIEKSSPNPVIVPGTDANPKRSAASDAADRTDTDQAEA